MNAYVREALEGQREHLRHLVEASRLSIEIDEERLRLQRDRLREQTEELEAIEAALEEETVPA